MYYLLEIIFHQSIVLSNYKLKNLAVNGAWSLWGPWSPLTGANNPETVTRSRTCDNPAPSNGGKSCEGDDKDTQLVYKRNFL